MLRSPWPSPAGGGAAGQRLDAGHQLGEVERLGQVVIGAQAQALDPLGDRAGGGEHQDPARRPLPRQGPADVVAVHAGQVPVQHHHVVAVHREPVQGIVAVEGHVDGHPAAAQPGGHRPGQPVVVFGYQDSHRRSPPPGWQVSATRPAEGDSRVTAVTFLSPCFPYTWVSTASGQEKDATMNDITGCGRDRPRRPRRRRGRVVAAVTVMAAVALLTAACGGDSPSAATGTVRRQQRALNYAKCMRAHGVPNFPDPNSQGIFPSSTAMYRSR
jgi:hypothetical protein